MDQNIIRKARTLAVRRGHEITIFHPTIVDMAVEAVCTICHGVVRAEQGGQFSAPRLCRKEK